MDRIRDALGSVGGAGRWTWVQTTGLARNAYGYFAGFKIDDVLPPSLRDFVNWSLSILPKAFGVRDTTRREQINANFILIGVTLLSSILTAGLTLALIVFVWGPLLWFAFFFRGTPAGESYWTRTRRKLPIKNDYDVPLWRSE
jgi:hypothetical protein